MAKQFSPSRFFASLGPGLVTGAADDDPSGIATYSIAGAQLGTSLLWTTWITWPLMYAVQMMCARIGMVTGRGLAGALKAKFPRPVLIIISLGLLIANTINIGADLSGMADAVEMLSGISSHVWVVVFGIGIGVASVKLCYAHITAVLKWLALVLGAYVVTAFMVVMDWRSVLRDTIIPTLPHGALMWQTLVAILGTTISPYLFFWQASQEVEVEKSQGRRNVISRQGATEGEISERVLDVGAGTIVSNLVMFFIIVTSAATLHAHGITDIKSAKDAAEALKPLAGPYAYALFTLGIVGTGLLAIPTLSGSAAYAFADTFNWRAGLDLKLGKAKAFYGVMLIATLLGIGMDFLHLDPMKALFWSAVVNGILAPFLLVGILIIARDPAIMVGQPSSRVNQAIVGLCALVMFGALGGMFL